jgi:tetratricopeptide (TPR) repeat protein
VSEPIARTNRFNGLSGPPAETVETVPASRAANTCLKPGADAMSQPTPTPASHEGQVPRTWASLPRAGASARLGTWSWVILWSLGLGLWSFPASAADYLTELRTGWAEYQKGNHTNSLAHYRAALAAQPRSLEPKLGLLLPLLADRQFVAAEGLAREILRDNKTHYLAHLRLATALRLQNKLRAADAVLVRALELYPSDTGLLYERGLVKRAQNQLAAARYYFGQAELLDPDNDAVFTALADPKLFADLAELTAPASPGFARGVGFRMGETPARLDATLYGGWIDYQGTQVKDTARLLGVATWLGLGKSHAVETSFDYIEIDRVGLTRFKQFDVNAAYNNFSLANWRLRAGAHVLANGDPSTDAAWSAFAGAEWFGSPRWGAGLDANFARYEDFGTGLEATQLAPKLGLVLATGADWTLRADTRGYWIHLSEDVGFGRRNFFSAEERLSLLWDRWTFTAFGWAGRQVFAARGDGATIFNLPEKHTAGFGAEVKRALSNRAAVAFRFNREEFRELGGTTTSAAHTFLTLLGYTF